MKEMVYCSHRDPQAEALSPMRNSDLPVKTLSGNDVPYDTVLHTMRNQEMMFYSSRTRGGF